jgi:hypothetical protein
MEKPAILSRNHLKGFSQLQPFISGNDIMLNNMRTNFEKYSTAF